MPSALFRRILLAAIVLTTTASHSFAVLLYRSPTRNTTAPTGPLANSGWQYQGSFGNFLGTPVAPNWFLTALHPGGTNTFTLNGTTYNIDQTFIGDGAGWVNGPHSDLRLWKIQGSFPSWAPLWDAAVDGSEVGKQLVVFGRGTQRGAVVYGPVGVARDTAPPGSRVPVHEQKGWLWGTDDHVQSWGTNVVDEIFDASQFDLGDLLTFDFDRISPLADESSLSNGDSGGAVFIKSGTTWKLAGLNYSVDGPFRSRPTGKNFLGSIYDAGGLYVADNPPFLVQDGSIDVPASSYSSRVSSNLAWIRSVIGPATEPPSVPEPASGLALLVCGTIGAMRRRRIS
ncbi:hypothetical protein BH09PLA1_BH09PLA1_21590 [soil metagenome]